ncbi:MAG: glutamate--tRNA ligase [Paenisporosarcina sp.]
MEKVRVRYSPSPTGNLHIGNARTALFNYIFARHHKGKFIIRIEDTDIKRNLDFSEQEQLLYLKWLGIDWDEGPDILGDFGPYRQSERKELYNSLIEQLLMEDKAYKCYMTEEELLEERNTQLAQGKTPHYGGKHAHLTQAELEKFESEGRVPVIRFRVPKLKKYHFIDIVKGDITFEGKDVGGDFVIKKGDGTPTYNFAVAIDDYMMEITQVLRGDDHISNTPKQMMIYEAFGWKIPEFGHMALIISSETKKKLSKREHTILQYIGQYRKLGYLPEAIFNFIALLGWSPIGDNEIFTKEELIKMFDANRLGKSPATLDIKKLQWINNVYIQQLSSDELFNFTLPYFIDKGYEKESPSENAINKIKKILSLYHKNLKYGAEIIEYAKIFYAEEFYLSNDAKRQVKSKQAQDIISLFSSKLKNIDRLEEKEIMDSIKSIQKETGIKGKELFMPLRAAVSGTIHGPELGKIIEILGKEKTLKHINISLS